MPYGDGTGPYGTGPIGWRRGPCFAGNSHTHWPIWRGLRTSLSPEEEREYLNDEQKQLEEDLRIVKNRLHELDK